MDTDLKKMKKITKFMQKEGILFLKTAELELHLTPAALLQDKPMDMPDQKAEVPESVFSEEDALFWSSPGLEVPQ